MSAAAYAALYAAHEVGDHWVQTSTQALRKGGAGWRGRAACARHVASLTACKAVAAALVVDAVSHYWADRRSTLAAFAAKVGRGGFARLGDSVAAPVGTGAYALDQSWHIGWLFVAALIIGGAA